MIAYYTKQTVTELTDLSKEYDLGADEFTKEEFGDSMDRLRVAIEYDINDYFFNEVDYQEVAKFLSNMHIDIKYKVVASFGDGAYMSCEMLLSDWLNWAKEQELKNIEKI